MENFLNIIASIGNFFLPIFVFLTMLNVGLTQKPQEIFEYLKDWPFYVRLLIANFILAPLTMYLLLQVFSIGPTLVLGLFIYSMSAGAPFLIKLTQFSDHDIALGASLMAVLVLGTSIFVPIALPTIFPDISVSAMPLFTNLVQQLIFPIVLGMAFAALLTNFSEKIQPWVAKGGNIALWIVVIGTLLGNIQGVIALFGEGAILAGVIFVLIATVIGYFLGGKNDEDHLQDIGALGTGQRNTAASMLIAANNFPQNPEIFLIITIANKIGLVMLVVIAKFMSKDNEQEIENT